MRRKSLSICTALLLLAVVLSGCASNKTSQEMLRTVKQYVDAYYASDYEKALGLTSGELYQELGRKVSLLKDINWRVLAVEMKPVYMNRDGTRGTVKCTVTWEDQTTESHYLGQHEYVFDLIKLQDGWRIYNAPTLTGPTDFDFNK